MPPVLIASNVTNYELAAAVAVQSLVNLLLVSFAVRNIGKLAKNDGKNRRDRRVAAANYTNCNTFHPVTIYELEDPERLYGVRYSQKHPERGRVDFRKSYSIGAQQGNNERSGDRQ